MSGTPKRLHGEGSHSTPLKRAHEDTGMFSGLSGKLIPPVGNDFHRPFESVQEGRLPKVQRTEHRELRDADKRGPLPHRFSSSPNNIADHPITSDSRLEFRNSKDLREGKAENKVARNEAREFNPDTRVETYIGKSDNDVRSDSRGDEKEFRSDRAGDEKEFRSDRAPHSNYKADAKFDRDNFAAPASQSTWSKEHHRGKRYYDSTSDGMDSWRVARHDLHNTVEVAKDASKAEWDSMEANEAVGENKIDSKGEEKFREKERKKKEEKKRDLGEREKDRAGHRNTMHPGEASNEHRELREEKEADRWEREKKETQKDKEHNGKEKDATKRESPIANEKENRLHEKEMLDTSARIPGQENTELEPKRPKDDNWKTSDRDFKDKKRKRDGDVGDEHEQCGKSYDKELDDGFAEGDGVRERDRESYGNDIPCKRMSRSRGNPQASHRELLFRSKSRDNEGSQGKPEVATVVYKAGDCVQELLESWKEFEASQESKNDETSQNYPTLEIRILAEHVTSSNRQVRGAQLWGTDIYTNDSDLFAVLMHTGYCRPTSSAPAAAIQELRATVRVLPPQEYYTSTLRNNVRSRAWGAGIGCSFRVERCCIMKKGGGTVDLDPRLTHISALEPTLAPVSVERTMTTRSAASNALHQQRFVREVSIQYNLCNEPWLKYSISMVADKGLKKPLYTSARLKKGEVLYLETHSSRYELCYSGEKAACNGTTLTSTLGTESEQEKRQHHSSHTQNGDRTLTDRENIVDVFRWSRCKKILPGEIILATGIPLRVEDLEIIEENLEWEDIQWSQIGLLVAGKTYALARVHFLSPKK